MANATGGNVTIAKKPATEIVDKFIASRRNLIHRNWEDPEAEDIKRWLISNVMAGHVEIESKSISYNLAEPVGETKRMTFKRSLTKQAGDQALRGVPQNDKEALGIALMAGHLEIDTNKVKQLELADFSSLNKLFGFFVQ
jgi:hypothetical protein